MTNKAIQDRITSNVKKLPYDLQIRVLDFTETLIPKGIEGKKFLDIEGRIPISELKIMSKAIEEECEKVNQSEW